MCIKILGIAAHAGSFFERGNSYLRGYLQLIFKKGYQLKDILLHCVSEYSPWLSFYLTPLSTAFEKSVGSIWNQIFRASSDK